MDTLWITIRVVKFAYDMITTQNARSRLSSEKPLKIFMAHQDKVEERKSGKLIIEECS